MLVTPNLKDNYGYDFYHHSEILGKKKCARVLIPNQQKNNDPFPICYLLPPFGTNRFFWAECLKNYYDQMKLPFIIVMPESGRNWFINDDKGRRYEDYFVHELIPKVEFELASRIISSQRLIGGFSMGGASSFFIGLKYQNLFKIIFSIAGAFAASSRIDDPYSEYRQDTDFIMPTQYEHERVWGNSDSEVRKIYNVEKIVNNIDRSNCQNKFILEVGKDDYPRMLSMNRMMHELLLKKGISHYYAEYGGKHDAKYAQEAIGRIILLCEKLIKNT